MRRHTARMRAIPALLLALVLAGCVSAVPEAIRSEPGEAVTVAEVQRDPKPFLGRRVRWGGTILAVRNRERTTAIEVLARPLSAGGEPKAKAPEQGRFIAELAGFLDPAEYPKDRLLTVVGRLERVETHPVGEYPYVYPVLTAATVHLWPEALPAPYPYPYPYPWYDPWYPWYGPWRPWRGPWYY